MSDAATTTETTTAATTAATTETTAAATAASVATAETQVAFNWKASGVTDDIVHNWVTAKGYKDPAALAQSAYNLEKLYGVPAEQIIKLPKNMTLEEMGPVYDRLGRPKTAADYKIPVPEGDSGEFAKQASGWFHELGLSQGQAEKLAAKWNEHVGGLTKAQMTEYTTKVEADKKALLGEWGAMHDANIDIAKQAAKTFGMDEAQISALEKTLGFAGVHKFLFNIGSKLGEAEFIQSGGKGGEGFKGMTPEMARQQIAAYRKDANFARRFNSADPSVQAEARAEMDRLTKLAYPGEAPAR